jgi:hypothetical protein
MLLPMVEQASAYAQSRTLHTADAGYHSDQNIWSLHDRGIEALIADNQMRQRDERLQGQGKHKPKDDVLYDKRRTGLRKTIRICDEPARVHAAAGGPPSKARRVRGELRAPPAGAAELGQAAQAGVGSDITCVQVSLRRSLRFRPGALPEVRWRAEAHCGDPGAAGDREDPCAPGIAGSDAGSGTGEGRF